MKIILFGPPGVGKGTQAILLRKKFSIPHISTGDILRRSVAEGTKLGDKAKHYMERGILVPDDIMIGIIKESVTNPECANGFILDGFPRTVPQAEALDEVFSELGISLNAVIYLDVDEGEIVRRLEQRLVCKSCNRIYNTILDNLKGKRECPSCGGELSQRKDDKPDVVRERLRVYNAETTPVRRYYENNGMLIVVNGMGDVNEVFEKITDSIKAEKKR